MIAAALTFLVALSADVSPDVDGALVLGFSEDGTRALLQEHSAGSETVTRYVVVGAAGTVLSVDSSRVAVGQEQLDRDACRESARKLESALADFRSVRVHESGCAIEGPARSLVDVRETVPSPLRPGDEELSSLARDIGYVAGIVYVNDRGPLVVIIAPDAVLSGVVRVTTLLRADPRINPRWANPHG